MNCRKINKYLTCNFIILQFLQKWNLKYDLHQKLFPIQVSLDFSTKTNDVEFLQEYQCKFLQADCRIILRKLKLICNENEHYES